MGGSPQLLYGVLRTRDLVELYYGRRMVVNVRQTAWSPTLGVPLEILQQDPRRIRYEIVIECTGTARIYTDIGTQADQDSENTLEYQTQVGENTIIERNFLSDMEGVTLQQIALFTSAGAGAPVVAVRETFLSPLPVDED
jgi:hypothetical protein